MIVQAHVNIISLYAILKRFERAQKHFEAAIKKNPNLSEAHYNYAVMLAVQNKLQEARESFETALQINPFYADAHSNLGTVLERQEDRAQALFHYRKAVENNPNHRLAHFNLSRFAREQGNDRATIEHLLKTVSVDDEKTPVFMLALADAYVEVEDYENALRYARRAKEKAVLFGQTALADQIQKGLEQLQEANISR